MSFAQSSRSDAAGKGERTHGSACERPYFIMQRRMMLNIKALAEQSAAQAKVRS